MTSQMFYLQGRNQLEYDQIPCPSLNVNECRLNEHDDDLMPLYSTVIGSL